jgi:hypothetical protein
MTTNPGGNTIQVKTVKDMPMNAAEWIRRESYMESASSRQKRSQNMRNISPIKESCGSDEWR